MTDEPENGEEARSLLEKLKQVRQQSAKKAIVVELTRSDARSKAAGDAP